MMWAVAGPNTLRLDRRSLEHAARTAIAALISLLLASLAGLPEAYWSAVTTLVVMQSSLGAAVTISAVARDAAGLSQNRAARGPPRVV